MRTKSVFKELRWEIADFAGLCIFGAYTFYSIKKDIAKKRTEQTQKNSTTKHESCEKTIEYDPADLQRARKILAQIELASFDCDHVSTKRFQ